PPHPRPPRHPPPAAHLRGQADDPPRPRPALGPRRRLRPVGAVGAPHRGGVDLLRRHHRAEGRPVTGSQLATVIVLGLAAYRVTRFLVIDTLLEPARSNFHSMLERRNGILWAKVYDLVSCTWCVGV